MKINLANKSIRNAALGGVALLALTSAPLLAQNRESLVNSNVR